MTPEQQHKKFEDVYNKLNTQQKQAVDTITGAIIVIAGPGTGKTQILGARIGKILLETDTLPQNILCLTYTDAGTIAMRKRLLSFIGADAYKVNIHTFHSFCNEVIQDNLHLFNKNSLNPISDLEKIRLFKELIDGFGKNNPLKRYRGDVYFDIGGLRHLFSSIKKENLKKENIIAAIDKYIDELPTTEGFYYKRKYKEFNAGDVKQNLIDDEIVKMNKLKSALNEFENFETLMAKNNLYDFDDMINWVIKAFEENENLRRTYAEQFNHILVDEYQDTSGSQNRIIDLLYEPHFTESLFVVGDDDQSIYRFQGANNENILNFFNNPNFTPTEVVLTNNYRSVQPILDISKKIIEPNSTRIIKHKPHLTKDIVAANPNLINLNIQPQIVECISDKEEMCVLALDIETLVNSGVEPKDIAVIYKENKYGEALSFYLKQKNIAYYSKRSLNVYNIPIAQQIINILNFIAAEHDTPYEGDQLLFEILHYNFFNIKPIDIAKLSVEVANTKFSENKTSIRALLHKKANEPAKDLFSSNLISQELKAASAAIEQLIADASNLTIQNLLHHIITKTGILKFVMASQQKHFLLKAITAVFDFVKEETSKNTTLSLQQLVDNMQLMQDEGIELPLIEVSGNERGVNLLTAHSSKGLEFEYVFIAGANAHIWEKKKAMANSFKLPDTVFNNKNKEVEKAEAGEEIRRLFYVALTRAAKHLTISYSSAKSDGKPIEPSKFIAEIMDEFSLPILKKELNEAQQIEFKTLLFVDDKPIGIEKIEDEFVTPLVEKFVMNVTALNNYLKCPLQFYYNNIVRVPSGRNEATEFGSAVHHALDQLFKKMQNNNNTFPSKEVFIKDFEWYINRHRENFTQDQFNRRMEQGDMVLSAYYDEYINSFNKIVSVEKSLRNIIVDGVPLKGKLDKLEFDGSYVNVVDYKTGNYEKAKKVKKTFDPPSEENEYGGDYWRQAVFYKILLDNNPLNPNWKAISTEFDFIEPDDKTKKFVKEKLIIQPQDITKVKEQIKTVWQKIQAKEFYKGCGKEDCNWCRFVKNNELSLSEELEESV